MKLSPRARSLWAKLSRNSNTYLPLWLHMQDSARVAQRLWNNWLPPGLRTFLRDSLPDAESSFVFLAASHDLGKAIPAFQFLPRQPPPFFERIHDHLLDSGLPLIGKIADRGALPHALASQAILERHGAPRELAIILGGHHGRPPSYADINKIQSDRTFANCSGFADPQWRDVQKELYAFALELAGFSGESLPAPSIAAQALLSGLVIMTDWIASGEDLFPLVPVDDAVMPPEQRVRLAWDLLALPNPVDLCEEEQYACFDLYSERFNLTKPRPVQTMALQTALEMEKPGIFIIEAPMGEGKTEAALAAAEIFAAKTGRSGLYFALPTQATSDGLFPRIIDWAAKVGVPGTTRSIKLAHGKSRFNEDYEGIRLRASNVDEGGRDDLVVHEWFEGRKKSMLADFIVGTVDHVLMGALRQKHLALRHLGLAGKVVVIDECHAYDAYMNSYLHRVLNWLGAYGVPVIILSATLPATSRVKLIEAYLSKKFEMSPVDPVFGSPSESVEPPAWTTSRAYPLLTFTDGETVKQISSTTGERRTEVQIAKLPDEQIGDVLASCLSGGGCAGVIVNTVRRGQQIAHAFAERFGEDTVRLLHARFLAPERVKKEKTLRDMLGRDGAQRPKGTDMLIVVGTQVMEQSLDVDFDVLVTDICPMDLLLQRMGRLHRHERKRPDKLTKAQCFITGIMENGFERGSENIYGAYLLMRTKCLLPENIILPDDIPHLVQDTYAKNDPDIANTSCDGYSKAKAEHEKRISDKKTKARAFQIEKTCDCESLTGWLDVTVGDNDATGRRAESTVRDGADSIEVIVIRQHAGKFYMLPGLDKYGGAEIPAATPDNEFADAVAGCTVKLPPILCAPWMINKTIDTLEKDNFQRLPSPWQESIWLRDELFLVLDDKFSCEILEYTLTYDHQYGLMSEKHK